TRSIAISPNIFRKPTRKMKKLIASPIIAVGRRDRENSGNEICEKYPMIIFCGFPTGVATLPMFALVARATRNGSSGSFPRLITATTSGVSIKQIVSLTSSAERIPEVSVTYSKRARRGSREIQNQVRGPFEKMREIEIGRDEHHAQQQYKRVVVDGAICAFRGHHTCC